MRTLFFLICLHFSQNIFAQQHEAVFYAMNMEGLQQYSLNNDTLTVETDNLRFQGHKELKQKNLLLKKETRGIYEIWYMKILDGQYARAGDYTMLTIENRQDKNTMGIFTSGPYATLELCEYALAPQPSDLYYFTAYTKPYFDSVQKFASFAGADENAARAVFTDVHQQMELFAKEKSQTLKYMAAAFQNFLCGSLLQHHFSPVVGEKTLNDVMVKYHIK